MTYPDFSTQTAPNLSELETRLSALEAALFTATDSTFTQWSSSIDAGGNTLMQLLLKATNLQSITLPSSTPGNLTSGSLLSLGTVSLAPGRYLQFGQVGFAAGGSGSLQVNAFAVGALQGSLALPSDHNLYRTYPGGNTTLPVHASHPLPVAMLDLSAATGNTTVYLAAQATWSVVSGTPIVTAYGYAGFLPLP